MNSKEVTLGYWAIRGLAEPIRLLMEYTGTKYNQKRYTSGEDWATDKASMGFDFPNLPYLVDGDKKITESEAILVYICIKSGHKELLGASDEELVNLAMVKGVFGDARYVFVEEACYNPDFNNIVGNVLKDRVFPKLEALNKYMGSGAEGLINTRLTYVDFVFYEFAQLLLAYDDKILENYPNLKAWVPKIGNLPQIQSYFASDRYNARPFNGFSATFNPK